MTRQGRDYELAKATSKISEAYDRLSFLLDSAPLCHTDGMFSREGLNGMTFLVGDVLGTLSVAQKIMKRLAKTPEGTA